MIWYKNFCYEKKISLLYWVGIGLLYSKSTCNTSGLERPYNAHYNHKIRSLYDADEFCGYSEAIMLIRIPISCQTTKLEIIFCNDHIPKKNLTGLLKSVRFI